MFYGPVDQTRKWKVTPSFKPHDQRLYTQSSNPSLSDPKWPTLLLGYMTAPLVALVLLGLLMWPCPTW